MQKEDFHIGMFGLQHSNAYAYLPPLYYDVLTVYGMKIYWPFSFNFLFSILKQDVWITFLLVVLICNLCYYLAHDNSPSLKYNPRIKNNGVAKLWRILFLDSLIRFQSRSIAIFIVIT